VAGKTDGVNKEVDMPRRRSTLRLGARFNTMKPAVRRAAPRAYKRLLRASPGLGRSHKKIRSILKAWGLKAR